MSGAAERRGESGPAAPVRPRMEPARGLRRLTLAPHEMTDRVTATRDVFALAHLGVPRVDPTRWSLTIDGLVEQGRTLDREALKARPRKVVEAVHQCCGSPLEPKVPTRRIANVRWGGVDLADLLDELGVDPRARFLRAYGLDGGDFAGAHCDWYAKDLPLERLSAGDLLLADELNGEPLPAEHGYPLRLVVPGYYGTNSVKWLWRLELAERRAEGLFTTRLYNDAADADEIAAGQPASRPVWAQAPEAIVVAPAPGTALALNEVVEIWGWAWSFRGIDAVEVSVDGGGSFCSAALEPRRGWGWQRFSLQWRPCRHGETLICARAFGRGGERQPMEGARNAVHSVRVVLW